MTAIAVFRAIGLPPPAAHSAPPGRCNPMDRHSHKVDRVFPEGADGESRIIGRIVTRATDTARVTCGRMVVRSRFVAEG